MFSHKKDDEVNYWPSVSDMFLVFFIIALCIVAGMYKSYSEGEKLVVDEVVYQSNQLFENLNMSERYDKEDDSDEKRPILAGLLMLAKQEYLQEEDAPAFCNHYRDAVIQLVQVVCADDKAVLKCVQTTDSARLLSIVNKTILKRKAGGNLQDEEEVDISQLKNTIADYGEQLKLRNEELEKIKTKLEELRNKLENLDHTPGNHSEKTDPLVLIDELDGKIVKLTKDSSISQLVLKGDTLRFYKNSIAIEVFNKPEQLHKLYEELVDNLNEEDESVVERKIIEIIGHTDGHESMTGFKKFFTKLPEDEKEIKPFFGEEYLQRIEKANQIANIATQYVNRDGHTVDPVGSGNVALGLARARRFEEEMKNEILNLMKDKERAKRRFENGYIQFRCYSAAQLYPLDENKDEANRRIEIIIRKKISDSLKN